MDAFKGKAVVAFLFSLLYGAALATVPRAVPGIIAYLHARRGSLSSRAQQCLETRTGTTELDPYDQFELRVFDASGDLELACHTTDVMRQAVASGQITEDDVAETEVQVTTVVLRPPDDNPREVVP